MKAMVLHGLLDLSRDSFPLRAQEVPVPVAREGEILIRVITCGVCHTELDEIEGRTPPPRYPVIPGHQVVGRIERAVGSGGKFAVGDRVGVAWIHHACGECRFCREGNENLCSQFRATGRDANGGYAEFMTVPEGFAYKLPDVFGDAEAAPLLCAGAVGYRALRLTGMQDGRALGLSGFGASGHLVLKLARHLYPRAKVFVFARSPAERAFSLELGADWAGDSADAPPLPCDSIIDTTPVWKPVVDALQNLERGGRLVINAIRKEDVDREALLSVDYGTHLWMEREIKTVANVSRTDVREFLDHAASMNMRPEVQEYPLEKANEALMELKGRKIRGAKVLRVSHG